MLPLLQGQQFLLCMADVQGLKCGMLERMPSLNHHAEHMVTAGAVCGGLSHQKSSLPQPAVLVWS